MKFVHLTDLHLVPPGQMLWGLSPADRLQRCLDDIARYHRDAEFCVITGDLTENGDAESYRHLRQLLSSFPLQTHLLPGNCDDRANFSAVFGGADENGFVQSAVELNGYRLLFLDTLGDAGSAAGRFDAARMRWLRRKLSEQPGTRTLLFMHHPPFRLNLGNDAIRLVDDIAFLDLVAGPVSGISALAMCIARSAETGAAHPFPAFRVWHSSFPLSPHQCQRRSATSRRCTP